MGIIITFIVICVIATLPESPKYYYANRMFDRTREKLKMINQFNKSGITDEEIDDIIFDTEIAKNENKNDELED